jgi:probable HAF family extracellular repeat protein
MLAKKQLHKLLGTALLAAPLAALADPSYSLTFLPENFKANDIGSYGLVVGSMGTADAFVPSTWTSGVLTTYGTLGGPRGQFNGISSNGLLTGVTDLSSSDPAGHAFVLTGGVMHEIGNGLGPEVIGGAINSSGQVAGWLWAGIRPVGAFLYNGVSASMIGEETFKFGQALDINDAGVVAGRGQRWDTDAEHAFMYAGGVTTDLGALDATTDYSEASAINSMGDIAGTSLDAASVYHAVVFSGGTIHDLGSFDGYANAYDINNRGQVVGFGANSGFLYTDGTMYDLNTLVSGLGGWRLTGANAINDAGQIVGTACTSELVCRDVLLNPVYAVPEPSTWAMLLAGLGAVSIRRKRRAKAAAPAVPA